MERYESGGNRLVFFYLFLPDLNSNNSNQIPQHQPRKRREQRKNPGTYVAGQ